MTENILVKDNEALVNRINTISDLFHFGYLVMGPGQPRLSRGRPAGLRAGARASGRSFAGAVVGTSSGGGNMEH